MMIHWFILFSNLVIQHYCFPSSSSGALDPHAEVPMADPSSPVPGPPAVRSGLPAWALLGLLFGLLGALSIWFWAPIGVSTTYPRFIGACLRLVAPGAAQANPMLAQIGTFATPESFLVLGLLLGGFLASRWGRASAPVPEGNAQVHTSEGSSSSRVRNAFIGGFLIIFGARMAGGCTSGHIISGITQLSISGFVFAIGVFASGILTAKALVKRSRS
jgi:hypothetical protein